MTKQRTQQHAKDLGFGHVPEPSMKDEFALAECAFSPATNLPAKDAAKHLARQEKALPGMDQREWSGDRPPAGITQCTWDELGGFAPKLGNTLRKPISAPRCLGSAANLQQRFGTGTQQQVVKDGFVL